MKFITTFFNEKARQRKTKHTLSKPDYFYIENLYSPQMVELRNNK